MRYGRFEPFRYPTFGKKHQDGGENRAHTSRREERHDILKVTHLFTHILGVTQVAKPLPPPRSEPLANPTALIRLSDWPVGLTRSL